MPDSFSPDAALPPDIVHAEVARLLTTPGLLEEDAGFGSVCTPEQRHQLRNFRGFITKVTQNGIRKYIPNTMAALSLLKVELEFYVAVSPRYQRRRVKGPIPTQDHLDWYQEALSDWVDQTQTVGGTLCCDILAHELVQNYAKKTRVEPTAPTKGAVWIEGEIVIRRYTNDVVTALQDLLERRCEPDKVSLETPMILAYWLDPMGGQVATEIDFLAAKAISLVDGKRSIEDIAVVFNSRGLPDVDVHRLKSVFDSLSKFGHLQMAS